MSFGAPIADDARRADRRAEQLLASAAGDEVLAMWRELGFLCLVKPSDPVGPGREAEEPAYGYLIYAHRPIVAFDASTDEPLSEFCVRFEDTEGRLPDADDVLAKWMALRSDEKRVIGEANIDRPGRQLDPGQVRRDLRTLRLWRARHARTWEETA